MLFVLKISSLALYTIVVSRNVYRNLHSVQGSNYPGSSCPGHSRNGLRGRAGVGTSHHQVRYL